MSSSRLSKSQTSSRTKSGNRESNGLTRERILRAALGLIDGGGVSALNMRELGRVLGVSTMAVYRYFQNKSDLLDEVIDHVVAMFEPVGFEGGWQEKAKATCLNVRAAMLTHPELAELIGREFRRSPTSLRVNAHIIALLRDAGVPAELLAQTYWAISSYTTGYTLFEAQARRRTRQTTANRSHAAKVRKIAAMMQNVEGISQRGLEQAPEVLARQLDESQFLFGLDCLISGLEIRIGNQSQNDGHSEA